MKWFFTTGVLAVCLAWSWTNAAAQTAKPIQSAPPAAAQKTSCDDAGDALARVRCSKTLRVGVRTGYPPFAFDDAGNRRGFEIDLARQLAESLGVSPAYVTVTPANRLSMLAEKKVDVVIATMGHTLQRDAQALFVRPHYYQSQTIVLGRKDLDVSGLVKLRGNTVCVTIGNSTNAELSINGARLKLFDRASQLVDELKLGGCSLVAQDNSFFATYLAQPDFALLYDTKFGFAPLPWGIATARADGGRLADVLGLSLRLFHMSGTFQALAQKYQVDAQFLDQQQGVWAGPNCSQITSLSDPACVIAPRDNQLEPTSFAPLINDAETFIQQKTGVNIVLAMLKTGVGTRLLFEGMAFSVVLVLGAVLATWACGLLFARGLDSQQPALRWSARFLLWPLQSTPLILLMAGAGIVVSMTGVRSPYMAMAAAVVVLGLYYGSSAGQTIAEAMTTLRQDRAPLQPAMSAAVYRARAGFAAFMVNAARGSPVASVMGVPELLSAMNDVASFSGERITTFTFLLIFYALLVVLVQRLVGVWQGRLALGGGAYA
ncbi:MAG: transporter substrate-binding domain-containing protein [Polaromonas sp.]